MSATVINKEPVDRLAAMIDAWRIRFAHRDALKLWHAEQPGLKREQLAFQAIVNGFPESNVLKNMSREHAVEVAKDAMLYSRRLLETKTSNGLTPSTASAHYVRSAVSSWTEKMTSKGNSEDVILSPTEAAETILVERWKRAIKIYPQFDPHIGRLCFMSVMALQETLSEIKPSFAGVVMLGAARYGAKTLRGQIERSVTKRDVTQVIMYLEQSSVALGKNPFDIDRLGDKGTAAQQLAALWMDATAMADFTSRRPQDKSVSQLDIWGTSERLLAYTAMVYDAKAVMKLAGKNSNRLLEAAVAYGEEAMSSGWTENDFPSLVRLKGDTDVEAVIRVAKHHLPARLVTMTRDEINRLGRR